MTASSPAPDFSKAARRPSEREAIVQYIVASANLQETDYLEWKSVYDLSTKGGAVKTAKHLIAFANREPGRAQRHAGGHAYAVLGAEAGQLHGIKVWDSADIENWLTPFVGPDLVYDVHYVRLQGCEVLFLDVEPPKQGDPIFCLQASTSDERGRAFNEGTIWTRRGGKSEQPNAAEMAMLSARARAAGSSLALQLDADPSGLCGVSPEHLSDGFRDQYLERRRRKLLTALPSGDDPFHGIVRPVGEVRSPEQFRREVDQFVERATEHWLPFALCQHLAANDSTLALTIVNPSDEVFEDVEIQATIRLSRPFVHRNGRDARETLKPPPIPREWGESLIPRVEPANIGPAVEIEEVDSQHTSVRFPPCLSVRKDDPDFRLSASLFSPGMPTASCRSNGQPRRRTPPVSAPG